MIYLTPKYENELQYDQDEIGLFKGKLQLFQWTVQRIPFQKMKLNFRPLNLSLSPSLTGPGLRKILKFQTEPDEDQQLTVCGSLDKGLDLVCTPIARRQSITTKFMG